MQIVDAAAVSHQGPSRAFNEDAVLLLTEPSVVAVADGLGGPGVGNVASSMAMLALQKEREALRKTSRRATTGAGRRALGLELERVLQGIHDEISASARRADRYMATTLAIAVVTHDRAHLAHVGAARAMLLRDGRLRVLTEDHTVGMARVRQGLMTPREYASSPLRERLYQAIGSNADVDVDLLEVPLADGDTLVMCTDGVHSVLDEDAIVRCLSAPSAQIAADLLVQAASSAGGRDDASAAVVRIKSDADPELIDEISKVLADTALFRTLTEAERTLVAPFLDHRLLKPGKVLFEEGDPGDAFFVVVDGLVRISRGETPLVDIGPGGSFGELCLARPVPRSATVTALEETLVFELPRDQFHEVVARRPAIGNKLLLSALDQAGVRLRDLTARLALVENLASGERDPGVHGTLRAITLAARGKLG